MRIFSEGFEYGDNLFWTTPFYTPTLNGRISGYACQLGHDLIQVKAIPDLSEFYFRFALTSNHSDHNNSIIFRHDSTTILSIGFTNSAIDRHVFTSCNGVNNTGVYTVLGNMYHLYEVHFVMSNTGVIQVLTDGNSDIDYSGDTTPGADTTINNIAGWCSSTAWQMYIDDLALNDTDNSDGKNDNSWCGDEHYEFHPANGNGDTNDWTGSDGDKVNNYALVDEVPPTGDTDYVRSDTPTEQDMYNITDFTDTGKIVTRLWSECRARNSNATAGEIKIGFKTGGSVYLCSTDRVLSSVYTRVVGDEAKVNPADSAAWEKADIDALQFVAECE